MKPTRKAFGAAVIGTALGVGGLCVIAVPANADETPPELPAISAKQLVTSTMRADLPAFRGTVEVDNNLGLPTLTSQADVPSLDFDSATVYSDGDGDARLAVHDGTDEYTVVRDGNTVFSYDSTSNDVTKAVLPDSAEGHAPAARTANPAKAAAALLDTASQSSEISVDGTATVADRAAYQLVLTPEPSEKTLLREIRVSVDAQTRTPLAISVMVNGTTEPALRIGFTDIDFGSQPAKLFSFTPPEGAEVTTHHPTRDRRGPHGDRARQIAGKRPHVVGEGWDTVVVGDLGRLLDGDRSDARGRHGSLTPRRLLERFGEKITGSFGTGHVIELNGGNVLVTNDGRVAAGAVPRQVLVDALDEQ